MFNPRSNKWILIDYGLATTYIDSETNEHISPSEKRKELMGSPLFASFNVHNGFEPTRRDDCISVFYMYLWFLLKGTLPWENTHSLEEKWQYKKWENVVRVLQYLYQNNVSHSEKEIVWKIINMGKSFYELEFKDEPNYVSSIP
jgi:hypothetical protein